MDIMSTDEFEPRTVDKVERLLDLLDEMERHPSLKGKLALHGGTAINLFMLDVPRLSVDIDVSYIGSVSREGMLADKPRIEAGIETVARALGYAVEAHPGGHAGRKGAHVRGRRARRRQGEGVLRPREGPRPLRRLQPAGRLQVARTR